MAEVYFDDYKITHRKLVPDVAYSYGFNGKEKDQNGEWGAVTYYDYGFRIYSPNQRKHPLVLIYQVLYNK